MDFKINLFNQTLLKQEDIKINDENINLAIDICNFAKSLNNCVGLASTQLNINKRICVVRDNNDWIIAINPRITAVSNNSFKNVEGCLSWPGYNILSERYKEVEISYYDCIHKKDKICKFNNFTAIIWQHEIDHLDGIEEEIVLKNIIPIINKNKIGRNELCPCKSGKKYKKCCG